MKAKGAATPAADANSSVHKACRLLRALSDPRNDRLTPIAAAAGVDKATSMRLLNVLASEGLVERDAANKRYALGRELMLLGATRKNRIDLRTLARPSLIHLAAVFEDTAILSLPSGLETVCADLQFGAFAIRANYLDIGSRRPLGVGAGSLAILAWMNHDEFRAALPHIEPMLRKYPRITRKILLQQIALARARGYVVVLDAVVEHMGGIAVPILGPDGRPMGALSVAALSERIATREVVLASGLRDEAATIETYWDPEQALHSANAPASPGVQ
jgi:DNA-binding IclR family transcriptional regulator